MQQVDTGDILLFRSQSQSLFGSSFTRKVTNSHFDHVCIILRFGEQVKDLYIQEAVGGKGVRLTSWANIRTELYTNGFFEKIVTRKLLFEMTSEKLNDLDQFRRQSVGSNYGIPLNKLLVSQASVPDLGNKSNCQLNFKKEREFFCSELVIKAFKVLDIIKTP